MKVLKNKIIYTGNGKIDNGYVRFNQRISEVDEMRNFVPQEDDEIIETDATYVIPGFVDVHSHGGYGKDSMDASADEIDDGTSDGSQRGNHNLLLHNDDADL